MEQKKQVIRGQGKHRPSSTQHKTLQKSSTLNRKFVKKPAVKARVTDQVVGKSANYARRQALAEQMNRNSQAAIAGKMINRGKTVVLKPVVKQDAEQPKAVERKVVTEKKANAAAHPTAHVANARVAARKAAAPRQLSAQELKDRAIKQALQRVATISDDTSDEMASKAAKKQRGWKKSKLVLAIGMATASIVLLGYLVHLNLPDLSVKVAAMQSGIESAYPAYVPKNYRMDGLVAEKDGKIMINFQNNKDGSEFTLAEEKSSWDSMALLSQFVVPNWGEDYSIVKEQGLTIYISKSNAAWVNGGIFYYIEDNGGKLTSQQLHDIAISL